MPVHKRLNNTTALGIYKIYSKLGLDLEHFRVKSIYSKFFKMVPTWKVYFTYKNQSNTWAHKSH